MEYMATQADLVEKNHGKLDKAKAAKQERLTKFYEEQLEGAMLLFKETNGDGDSNSHSSSSGNYGYSNYEDYYYSQILTLT